MKLMNLKKNFQSLLELNMLLVANGTDALTIALKILNLPKSSEVIILQ